MTSPPSTTARSRQLKHPAAVAIAVLAKEPAAGRVKTRLCPPYTSVEAARLAAAALADTLDVVAATAASHRVLVLDGDPRAWRRPGWHVLRQRGRDLGERLDSALADTVATTGRPVLLIGMDTPQLSPAHLGFAATRLVGADAVLGPACDGGFWAIGVHRAHAGLCEGVPMSRSDTGRQQLARMQARGLVTTLLPELTDVDDAASAADVAALVPESRFGRLVTRLAAA